MQKFISFKRNCVFLMMVFLVFNSCQYKSENQTRFVDDDSSKSSEEIEDKDIEQTEEPWSKDHSVDYNMEITEREELRIKAFLKHYSFLNMTLTNSGLRYVKYVSTKEKRPNTGDNVKFTIDIKLMDRPLSDSSCYKTATNVGYEELQLGKGEIESGIHEALFLMRKGEKLKCILPSYLGHGLIGDRYTIPPQALLYVDIHLIDFN